MVEIENILPRLGVFCVKKVEMLEFLINSGTFIKIHAVKNKRILNHD